MESKVNLFKSIPMVGSVGKISELPIIGNQVAQSQVSQMSVQELKKLIDTQVNNLLLIDVRNQSEYEIAQLPGWILIPYPEIKSGEGIAKIKQLLKEKYQSLDNNPHLIVMCKAGVRSAKTLFLLKNEGITGTNVQGGIDAWSQEIDPSIPQYSMKDISVDPPTSSKLISKKQMWLVGGGLAVTVGTIAAALTVAHKPDLLIPVIKAGVPLKWAAPYSNVVKFAVKRAETPQITSQELKKLIDSKATDYLLLDVRTPEEYKLSKIPGAVNVPITEIQQGRGIDKVKSQLQGRRLIAYCTHGYRSGVALVALQDAGIPGTQYSDGIQGWTKEIDPSLPPNGW
ncbi:rhodanese-like domain-containing protein [Microcoleus sp. herbarium7]|uniref:rhodanese-like domain-containing protein n=1 Tax=Microcoleus sp. herbarium7 TaxID=3055435 RepID=UPI002FD4F359